MIKNITNYRKKTMKKQYLLIALMSALLTLTGCQDDKQANSNAKGNTQEQQTFNWKLVTSWPKNFPGLGYAPERFAKLVDTMSNGRLKIKVYAAGELVPALQVFDAVSQGTAEMGHSGAYYWKGKVPAAQFFTTVPFGLTAQEINGWMAYGGGQQLWEELYKPFGILPLPGGNTGVQMGGWFNKKINSVSDLKGLKMRMPGIGGEVLKRAGGVPVNMPGGEIFTSLQTGTIDATEWVGPYNDLAFGLYKAAKYYYYPGWHEPGSMMEFSINLKAFNKLPKDLQQIVRTTAQFINQDMLNEYTSRNNAALVELVEKHGVKLLRFPKDVISTLRVISNEVINELAAKDPAIKKVYNSFDAYRKQVSSYHKVSEQAFLETRE